MDPEVKSALERMNRRIDEVMTRLAEIEGVKTDISALKKSVAVNKSLGDKAFGLATRGREERLKLRGALSKNSAALAGAISANKDLISNTISQMGNAAEDTRRLAVVCANVSFFYGSLAKEYLDARKYVLSVVAEKDTIDIQKKILSSIGRVSLDVLLAGVSVGISIGAPFAGSVAQQVMKTVQGALGEIAKIAKTTASGLSSFDVEKSMFAERYGEDSDQYEAYASVVKTGTKHGSAAMVGAKTVLGVVQKLQRAVMVSFNPDGEGSSGTLMDPFQYFITIELAMRKLVQRLVSLPPDDQKQMEERLRGIEKKVSVRGTKSQWNGRKSILFVPLHENEDVWRRFKKEIRMYMRQHVWSTYCRSQWGNLTFRYSMKGDVQVLRNKQGALCGANSIYDWPGNVFVYHRGRKPRHWDTIVEDFKMAGDTIETEKNVTRAVVACSQVRRPTITGWLIDLQNIPDGNAVVAWVYLTKKLDWIYDGYKIAGSPIWTRILPTLKSRIELMHALRAKGGGDIIITKIERLSRSIGGTKKGTNRVADNVLEIRKNETVRVWFRSADRGVHRAAVVMEPCDGAGWDPCKDDKLRPAKDKSQAPDLELAPRSLVKAYRMGSKNFHTKSNQHLTFKVKESGRYLISLEPDRKTPTPGRLVVLQRSYRDSAGEKVFEYSSRASISSPSTQDKANAIGIRRRKFMAICPTRWKVHCV